MRACLLSYGMAVVALLGAGTQDGLPGGSWGAVFVAVLAAAVGIGLYFRFREQLEAKDPDSKALDPARLEKMTLLWYALSLVLAIGALKEPIRLGLAGRSSEIEVTGWLVGALSVGVGLFALWRILGPLVLRKR